jgi:hypothetical protein
VVVAHCQQLVERRPPVVVSMVLVLLLLLLMLLLELLHAQLLRRSQRTVRVQRQRGNRARAASTASGLGAARAQQPSHNATVRRSSIRQLRRERRPRFGVPRRASGRNNRTLELFGLGDLFRLAPVLWSTVFARGSKQRGAVLRRFRPRLLRLPLGFNI